MQTLAKLQSCYAAPICKKDDFTDEDIRECQNKIDLWFHD
jgi:hypothetical protein